jgi:hypothetical protein
MWAGVEVGVAQILGRVGSGRRRPRLSDSCCEAKDRPIDLLLP